MYSPWWMALGTRLPPAFGISSKPSKDLLALYSALQQVVHRHGAPVVVDVIAPLSVGEDLNPLDEARGVRGGQRVGAVGVHHAEGDFQAFRVDEGGAAGERDAADPGGGRREGAQGAGEILHVVACGDVAGVARLELVAQALHELILRARGDYLHLCCVAFTCTARGASSCEPSPELGSFNVSGQLLEAGRRQSGAPRAGAGAAACGALPLRHHWVDAPGEGPRRVVALGLYSEAGC